MNAGDRRALVWGGTAILSAVLGLRALPWAVRSLAQLHDTAVERQATLAQAREVLAEGPAVRDSLGRLVGEIVGLAPKLVEGQSAAEAQASLTALVSLAAGRHALKIARLDPLPDSAKGVFNRVAVHAELEGDIAGLARLLRALETATPMLSVTSLAVTAADPWERASQPEVLRVELDVAGYYLPRGTR